MEEILDDSIHKTPLLKQRHGCVSVYLIFMIVANALTALTYFFASQAVLSGFPNANISIIYLLIGFLGYICTTVATFAINYKLGVDIRYALIGFISIGVLYAILQIKKGGVSAWKNMES